MITINRIVLEPGSELDFSTEDQTTIEEYVAGDWTGTITDGNIIDSEDGATPATIIIPQDIYLSFCTISNISVTAPYHIYADYTCIDGGGNNENVVFNDIPEANIYVLIGGIWRVVL